MATKSPPEKVLKAHRDTVRSQGKSPAASVLPGRSGTSEAGQDLRAEMTAADAIFMTGENLGLFSVPENQHFDPEGSRGPNIELGRVRPKTRSQREVGRIASRLGSDHQRSHKIKMELNLEPEPKPESEPEPEEEEAEPEPGPSSQAQARLSTSRPAVPRRSLLATTSSPPRRPVRMRASSPSPPGRLYPFPGQYNEGASSSSSFTNEDVSCVSGSPSFPNKSPERGSSSPLGDLSSVSGPSPDTLWRALIPDLDNLDSSSSGESEEEIEIAPHTPA
ncbi:protein eyes shut-like [Grammomys surdaster]|uniref:protein eyes shut-like n=1 Tax=Grammomys surdaster TaxID=491861 RepID=UPI00109EFACF|nr:protein eyes shut-like [Grammomys surdaster]